MILQQWLIQQRHVQQITLEQLAKQLGQTVGYIQDVESGIHILDVIEYLYYCKALGIKPNRGIELIESALTADKL